MVHLGDSNHLGDTVHLGDSIRLGDRSRDVVLVRINDLDTNSLRPAHRINQ